MLNMRKWGFIVKNTYVYFYKIGSFQENFTKCILDAELVWAHEEGETRTCQAEQHCIIVPSQYFLVQETLTIRFLKRINQTSQTTAWGEISIFAI